MSSMPLVRHNGPRISKMNLTGLLSDTLIEDQR
jgi:hypothetical protein